jgi:hypothetical protein
MLLLLLLMRWQLKEICGTANERFVDVGRRFG